MNLHFLQWRSLKTRVTLFTLAIFLIGIWSLAFYADRILRKNMEHVLGEQQFSTASFAAAVVNQNLNDRLGALERAAGRVTPAILANTAALQAFLEDRQTLQGLFNAGIVAMAPDSTVIADVPLSAGRLGANYKDRDYIVAALREGKSTIGKPIVGKILGAPLFAMIVPIHDAKGRTIGALMGVTDLGKPNFLEELTEGRYGKTGGFMVIAPRHQLIVTSSDKSRIMQTLPAPGINTLLDRYMQGYEGFGKTVDSLGVEYLSAAKKIPIAGWLVVVRITAKEAFAPIHDMLQRLLLAAILLTLLAGGLTWWILRRELAPMLAAAGMLATLSDQNQPLQALPVVRQDEIGDLIGGFNRLLEILGQREEALKESQNNLAITLNSIGDAVICTDADGRVTRMNPTAERLSGWTLAGALGHPLAEVFRIVNADTRETMTDPVQLVMARGEVVGLADHTVLLARNGREYQITDSAAPIHNDAGNIVGVVLVFSDITEKYQVEAALRENEARFRSLTAMSSDYYWETDADHRFTKRTESKREAMESVFVTAMAIGKRRWEVAYQSPDEVTWEKHRATLDAHLPFRNFEISRLRANGRVHHVAVSGDPVFDSAGEFQGYRGVGADITERKQAEAESRTLSRATEQSPATIIITDDAGNIEYVNPRFEYVTGYTRAEALGKNPRILKSGTTPAETYRNLWKAISEGGEWRGELCNRRKDGELFWEFAAISGVRGEDGEIEHYIAVKEDITERKQAEAARDSLEVQLRESQKMQAIGTLAGGIAHDFNNIVAIILGNVELARRDVSANPIALESLDEIHKASARARDLVQQILSFSRRRPAERKLTALAPIVEESVRLLRSTLPARLSLAVQCEADVPPVLADVSQIQQVLINLATNAMQAMRGRPGRIDIRLNTVMVDASLVDTHPELRAMYVKHPGRAVRLMVTDNGPGMDDATIGRIFEPFFTTKPVGEGTGLGLSIVHGIVQGHGGGIVVESQPGKGSTFTLYLPAAEMKDAETTSGDSDSAATVTPGIGSGQRILYIDDDESLVFLVKRLLERRGYRVSGYINQREALDALRADPQLFDLVVSDYNMPGMSGLDVAREVRAIRADLPVALATGFIDEELRAQADGAGVLELIFKADAAEDLCDAFARLVQMKDQKSKFS